MIPTSIDAVPPAPRTPSPRASALVLSGSGGDTVVMLVGAGFLLLGTLFALVFCAGIPGDLLIDATGRTVKGELVSQRIDESTKVNGVHPTIMRFRYVYAGKPYTDESSTLTGLSGIHVNGDPIQLEVSTVDPSIARIAGTTRSWTGYGGLFVLIFPFVGASLLCFMIISRLRRRDAFINGTPVLVEIANADWDRSIRINGRNPWRVRWEFRVGSIMYDGSISAMDRSALDEVSQATQLIVLYNPSRPSSNVLYLDE